MMVDPLPAALHIQRQHSEAKPKYTLTSGRTYHQEGRLGMWICFDMLLLLAPKELL